MLKTHKTNKPMTEDLHKKSDSSQIYFIKIGSDL